MNARSLFLTIASVALFAGCAQQAPPAAAPDTSADQAAIRAGIETFVTAWNAGDAATYGAMIADDAIQMPQGAEANKGRDAILAAMASGVDVKTVQQSATVDEVFVTGDYANAYGTWRLDAIQPTDPPAEATTGKWMAFYHRTADGHWVIWRWMWNQTSGPPVPPA